MCNITLVRFTIACSLDSVLVYSINLQNSKTPLHLNIPANIICCGFGRLQYHPLRLITLYTSMYSEVKVGWNDPV